MLAAVGYVLVMVCGKKWRSIRDTKIRHLGRSKVVGLIWPIIWHNQGTRYRQPVRKFQKMTWDPGIIIVHSEVLVYYYWVNAKLKLFSK